MERVDKTNYYLDIAETILERGTCLRNNYGSVIVKNDEIISTGYSGAPRGRKNCLDLGYCIRKQKTDLSGAGYEMCRSVHSEQNAIISANRRDMLGATLYLVGINKRNGEYIADNYPCTLCKRMIINAGIEKAGWFTNEPACFFSSPIFFCLLLEKRIQKAENKKIKRI